MKSKPKNISHERDHRRVAIISRPFILPQKSCEECNEPSGMITPDEAAALCEVGTRTVYRWLENGTIHFTENAEGALLICLKSLADSAMKTKNSQTLRSS